MSQIMIINTILKFILPRWILVNITMPACKTHVPVMLVETVSVSALPWQPMLQHAADKESASCGGVQPFAVSLSKDNDQFTICMCVRESSYAVLSPADTETHL